MFNTFNTLRNEKQNYYRYCQNQIRQYAHYVMLVQRGKLDSEQYDIQNAVQTMYFWGRVADAFVYGLKVGHWSYHLHNLWDDVRLTLNLL